MKLVIDTNILMSALIKDSITREIIFESGLNFYYPMESFKELQKYEQLILEKSGMDEREFEILLDRLLGHIQIVPQAFVQDYFNQAIGVMTSIDPDDVIFIATALARNASIWSDDKHFQQQNKIKIFTTKEIIENLNS